MLPGILGSLAGISGVREFSYLGIFPDASGFSDTQSIPSVDYGLESVNRRLFFSVHWADGGGGGGIHQTLDSITVSGSSATIHSQGGHHGGASGFGVALCSIAKNTGTTGTVVCTFSDVVISASCTVIRTVGLINSSPHDTAQDSSSGTAVSLSTTIDVPADGFTMAAFTGSTFADKTGTWSGVTEEFDNGSNGSSLAWDSEMAVQTGRTISFTVTTEADAGNHMLVLSWT